MSVVNMTKMIAPLWKLRIWTWCILRWEMHLRRSCIVCNPNPGRLRLVNQGEHTCLTSWIYSPLLVMSTRQALIYVTLRFSIFLIFTQLYDTSCKMKGTPALVELFIFSSQALLFPRMLSAKCSPASQWWVGRLQGMLLHLTSTRW